MIVIQILSKTPHAKRELFKNEKYTWSLRDCICSNFYFRNHLLNVSLERKTNNILHYHTAYDYGKGSKSRWYTTARCWYTTSKPFSPRMFTNPGLLLTNVAVYDKQTELSTFRSPGISVAGIQRWVAYTDGQRNRYLLLYYINGFCSLCCSNTPYDDGNVVCFSFQ